jgi:pyruvate/2-oxoglutarate dehydrogenase complex dihydrolipoamide dehydrogenase (E3) component
MSTLDAIIIGTGQAGPPLAARLAQAGLRVAIIEQGKFGGTCVNNGCTPTKTLIASAYVAKVARGAAGYGIEIGSTVRTDMTRVKARKDALVERTTASLEKWLRSQNNVTVYQGHARFLKAKTVQVGAYSLTAERIFIDVGGRPFVPQLPGVDQVPYLTRETMMNVDFLPDHLIVIGGSYVGLEFGQMYRRFGSRVSIVEMAPRLIGREDPDISEGVRQILAAEDMTIRLQAKCIALEARAGGVRVNMECADGDPAIDGTHVLLAVGRTPNTDDLGLKEAGIEVDERGYIKVDEYLRTSAPDVYALGDCNGKGAFTHTAYDDYEIVADNLLNAANRKVSDRITVYALFTDPPLGRAGLTEDQARHDGYQVQVGRMPMTQVARAREKGETQGFMKVVVDAASRRILGAAILGTSGDEVVQSLLSSMYARLPYTSVQREVRIHPTVSELLPTLLEKLTPGGQA